MGLFQIAHNHKEIKGNLNEVKVKQNNKITKEKENRNRKKNTSILLEKNNICKETWIIKARRIQLNRMQDIV